MKKSSLSIFIYALLAIIIVCSVWLFATTLTHALVAPASEQQAPTPPGVAQALQAASSTLPVRLIIPKIGIDANVQHVGISQHGTMAVPTNYTDVAWYKYGPIPGHLGTAVIDGHLDNGFGTAAVLLNLKQLEIGDEVDVVDASGNKLAFKVINTGILSATSSDTQTVFQPDNTSVAKLNLITCSGDWMPEAKSYNERLIVYTQFVGKAQD